MGQGNVIHLREEGEDPDYSRHDAVTFGFILPLALYEAIRLTVLVWIMSLLAIWFYEKAFFWGGGIASIFDWTAGLVLFGAWLVVVLLLCEGLNHHRMVKYSAAAVALVVLEILPSQAALAAYFIVPAVAFVVSYGVFQLLFIASQDKVGMYTKRALEVLVSLYAVFLLIDIRSPIALVYRINLIPDHIWHLFF